MKIKALEAFTIRDSSTGALTSIAHGSVADLDNTLANELITEGLAEAYTLVSPSGKKTITGTTEVDVSANATAQVVDEDLVAGNIKKDVNILGVTGSFEGGSSDFTLAEVTLINSPEMDMIEVGASINYPFSEGYGCEGLSAENNKIDVLTYNAVGLLYFGTAHGYKDNDQYHGRITGTTGGVTLDPDTYNVTVTGDGTISLTWEKDV